MKTDPIGLTLDNMSLIRLAYADDIILISGSREQLRRMASSYCKIASRAGLQVSEDKTEYMVLSKAASDGDPLTVDSFCFKRTSTFKYLGSLLNDQNNYETEINARISGANKAYFSLQEVLKKRSLSRNFKIRIYQSMIMPVVMYGCETLTFRRTDEQKLHVFERKILRKIYGPVRDTQTGEWKIRNNHELTELYAQTDIIKRMKKRRLTWAGHVARMSKGRIPHDVFLGAVAGRRGRGRPRSRWKDNIDRDTEDMGLGAGEWWHEAHNREQWRRSVEQAYGH